MVRSDANSNIELVANLKKNGVLKSQRVEQVLLTVDRGHYTQNNPYEDKPQGIGHGVTISAPHMHTLVLEYLKDNLYEGAKVLDIGSGSGYSTVSMALLVGQTGLTIGVELIPELVAQSIQNIKRDQPGLYESERIKFIVGDGKKGYANAAPYDAIFVGAASPEVPKQLLGQLKPGGCMICPVGACGASQALLQVKKLEDGTISQTSLMGVMYGYLKDAS
ncbi:protein-L-isoaspartate(D-aspartate) O-methyltransferase-like [Ornithodoros turicata]